MAVKSYTRDELEKKFEKMYRNRCIRLTYPGYPPAVGKVDVVAVDHNGNLVIQMNEKRYQVSLESVTEVIKLL